MPTITIQLPLHEPTQVKQQMYKNMQESFSSAANNVLFLKKQGYKLNASQIDAHISHFELPSTLVQEARKLAVSRFTDWKKNKKTKGFPLFKKNLTLLFNNQNWQLRLDNGHLKVGIPTTEPGNLTAEKYVPVKMNSYSLFWAHALLGTIDTKSKHYINGLRNLKKASAQLGYKNKKWYFSFTISFDVAVNEHIPHAIGVDRGLRQIAVCGDALTGNYLTFSGRHLGHVRRRYAKLRRKLQKAKNMKKVKQLQNKEQRITQYHNHVIAKQIVQFAGDCRATLIKLEDLTGIRNMKKYWKRNDRNVHSWAFFDLATKIEYKASLVNMTVGYVDPYKTSQECHACGLVLKTNRRRHHYTCSCGYHENADVNASFVISKRPLLPAT